VYISRFFFIFFLFLDFKINAINFYFQNIQKRMFVKILLLIISLSKLNQANSIDNLMKVEEAANIYVGTYLIQKIKSFYVNESLVSCEDRYLPIILKMLNSKNEEIEVQGLLTEFGNLITQQEKTNCKIFKKYI